MSTSGSVSAASPRAASTASEVASTGVRLRAWVRYASIRHPRTREIQLGEVARWTWRSVMLAVKVVPYVRRYGSAVQVHEGVSHARQIGELLSLWWRYRMPPDTYYRFQLYRPDRWARAPQYLQQDEHRRLLRPLTWADTRAFQLMRDKRRIEQWSRENGLPGPPTLMTAEKGAITPADLALPPDDLFVKPATLSCGEGAALWRYDAGRARYVGAGDEALTADELRARIEELSRAMPMLVQRRLRNHAAVIDLTAGGLCTARIVTLRDGVDEPSVLLARYRIPVGDAPTDNFAGAGGLAGIAAPIDLATGRLGRAVFRDLHRRWESFSTHPTTGAPIEGRILPDWDAACALALRAHTLLPPYPMVGWDVVLTDDGPLLLEANSAAGAALAQMADGVPLADTAYARVVLRALEQHFGTAEP